VAGITRIVSDLHLGHPGCRIRSVGHLRPLFEGAATVVFNGDTVEQRHRLLAPAGARLLAELRSLLDEVGARPVFLRGNHDPEISTLDHLDLAGNRVFVTHGDALFRHLSPWSPKVWKAIPRMEAVRAEYGEERLTTDLASQLECTHRCRALSEGTELEFKTGRLKTLRTLSRIAWPPGRPIRILTTWLTIPGHAHDFSRRYRSESRAILFGHSHFAGVWSRPGRTAINTGGFVSLMPARAVDLADGVLTIRRVAESGDAFAPGGVIRRIDLGED